MLRRILAAIAFVAFSVFLASGGFLAGSYHERQSAPRFSPMWVSALVETHSKIAGMTCRDPWPRYQSGTWLVSCRLDGQLARWYTFSDSTGRVVE